MKSLLILLSVAYCAQAAAPEVFSVKVETTQGDFVIEAHRSWAPHGVDRFYELVQAGFFDDSRFFRVRTNFIAQFGIPGDPAVAARWRDLTIPDDAVNRSNLRGFVSYAMTGPNTRATQLYINLRDNPQLDAQGFAPIGRVVEGVEVLDKLYAGYGEDAGGGMRGGKQAKMFAGGNSYLDREFPKLDKLVSAALLQTVTLPNSEGDWIAKDFHFTTGETLSELKLHYTTLGKPERDTHGVVRNAVLIMHGTGGSGRAFLSAGFGGQLFGAGQLLDAATHYIILPDAIGCGKSSKPSDGLHMRFPKFTYDDMVRAQYLLVTQGLSVNHLRLVMGTSMGAMHSWIWGEMYPDFMDALMPLASQPVEIGGRNRMLRKMIVDCIQNDPEWNEGEYAKPPLHGLMCAQYVLSIMTSSPLQLQKQYPTRASADAIMAKSYPPRAARTDANDMIYAYESSRLYNPQPNLDKIRAPLYAINSADDQVNPPELGIGEREIKHVKRGRFILIPISNETRGHGTHSMPAIWGKYLKELLDESKPR